jgi:hypothetical protein
MSILDGFTTFDFNEGAPYVSITKNGVTFNKGVIKKLKQPAYVVLLINAKAKQIAIQVCDEATTNATTFFKEDKKSNLLSVRWNGRDLLNTISEITEWDLVNDSYKVLGTHLIEENAMLFDLDKAEEIR